MNLPPKTLTQKEAQVFDRLSRGYLYADIAAEFGITLQAVKNMCRTGRLKLGAETNAHAVAILAYRHWERERGQPWTIADNSKAG